MGCCQTREFPSFPTLTPPPPTTGWVTNFLSHAQISGFMSGSAFIILFGQVQYILGLYIPAMGRANTVQEQVQRIVENFWQFK